MLYALWQGDLNQDLFLSPMLKGTRLGFIRNSTWTVWAKPALRARRCQRGGRGVQRCRAHSQPERDWAGQLQSQAGSGHSLGLHGAQHCEWVERESQQNMEWIECFTFYIPLVENRLFSLYLEIPRGNSFFWFIFFSCHQNFPYKVFAPLPSLRKKIFFNQRKILKKTEKYFFLGSKSTS